MVEISLPRMDGSSERYRLAPPSPFPQAAPANGIRTVYAQPCDDPGTIGAAEEAGRRAAEAALAIMAGT